MNWLDRFEYSAADDRALNYCLWPYERPAPAEDKFRSVNLLFQTFAVAGMDEKAYALVEALRDELGPWRTVFGVKLAGGRLAWEFYFYDYQRRRREVSISRVVAALTPFGPCKIAFNESLPYFMFSIDIDDELVRGERGIDLVHMYVGVPGSEVSSGAAYGVRGDGIQLENFYFFFDAATQLREVAKKVCSSAFFDETVISLDSVIIPEFRNCKTICVANKRSHDCIYFAGIDVNQLIWFLEFLKYPTDIIYFIRGNRDKLDHLLFDAGFDYRYEGGELRLIKSGYYGVF